MPIRSVSPYGLPLSGIEPLVVDKAVEPIPLTESRVISILVLPDSALHLPRHSGGERAVSFVGDAVVADGEVPAEFGCSSDESGEGVDDEGTLLS